VISAKGRREHESEILQNSCKEHLSQVGRGREGESLGISADTGRRKTRTWTNLERKKKNYPRVEKRGLGSGKYKEIPVEKARRIIKWGDKTVNHCEKRDGRKLGRSGTSSFEIWKISRYRKNRETCLISRRVREEKEESTLVFVDLLKGGKISSNQ